MKKKIMIGLGAITAIAAPVVGLISCGDKETLADKMISVYPDKIEVKVNNKDFDFLKSMTTDGKELKQNEYDAIEKGIENLDDTFKNKMVEVVKNSDLISFAMKAVDGNAKDDKTAKVIKGFADNKITIEIKIKAEETHPKKIDRGTATKTIDITFLAS